MPSGRDVVVVAASAGGLQPLRSLLRALPADLPAALFVVLHVPATGGRSLPRILDRAGPLPADQAVDGDRIRRGRVYVAPPDQHLLVVRDTVRLSRGPRRNGVRPAADPLFRSAALHAGPRVTAVVLSGTLDDAALGSATVERLGGQVIAQEPGDCDYDSMPRNTIGVTRHPIVVPTPGLAREVVRQAGREGSRTRPGAQEPDGELATEISGLLSGAAEADPRPRARSDPPPSLVEEPRSLVEEQSSAAERALWLAIRSLEERARLTGRLADAARARRHELSARQFSSAAAEARRSADTLREAANGMAAKVAPERRRA